MTVVLPKAPRQYDVRDQDQLRRILMRALREIENRLRALENPPA